MRPDIPAGWSQGTLGDIASINPEQLGRETPPSFELEYLDIASVERPGALKRGVPYAFYGAPSRARRPTRAGDILVSTVRPYLRSFAMVREDPGNLVASTGFAVVRAADPADQEFVLQHILSGPFVDHLKPLMTGSNYPAVRPDDVERYPLLLPPASERKQIGMMLAQVDVAIAADEAVVEQLVRVRREVAEDLLTRGLPQQRHGLKRTVIGTIPESWDLKVLHDVGQVQTGLSKGKTPSGAVLELPYLRVANVQDGHVDLEEMKTVAVEPEALERYRLRSGDVLFTEGGDFDKLGRGCVWRGQIDPCLHQNHVFAVRTNEELLPDFLAAHAASRRGRAYFLDCAKRTTNLASINSTQLKALPVPIPPLDEQQSIVEAVGAVTGRIEKERAVVAERRRLKAALADALLTGKIRVLVRDAA